MHLLFLTSRLPYPPDRGDRRRVLDFIKILSKEHNITLLSFIAHNEERKNIPALQNHCQNVQVVLQKNWQSALTVGLNLWRTQPLQTLFYRSNAMQKLVDQVLSDSHFDAVYVHLFRMAPYVVNVSELYRIVDLTDVISKEIVRSISYRSLLSRMLYKIELPRIERYERWVAENYDEIWLISEHDRSILTKTCPQANIQIVPHWVNIEKFSPIDVRVVPNSMIFVGHMSVFHNVDAVTYLARDIFPLVRNEIPDCSLKIVGASPSPQVQNLSHKPGIEVTGFVTDLNMILNQSAVFVAPLRFAAGVQNKVIEAMAAGRPVITTSLVNEGVGAQPGRDLILAEGARETANTIIHLFRNTSLRKELGQSARKFVVQKNNRDLVRERMNQIIST